MRVLFLLLITTMWQINVFAQKEFTLNIHEIGDPDGLNPLLSTAANAENIESNIFCKLLEFNRETFELEPALAAALPVIKELKEGKFKGGMSLTYEIHPEAIWDNGMPVTGMDYIFTVKAAKHHLVESAEYRLALEFIDDIELDAENPKKFTIYSHKPYFRAAIATGVFWVMPEKSYDPNLVLREITITQLNSQKKYSTAVNDFAKEFNDKKYATEALFVKGCGPYKLLEWSTGAFIKLERKKDWWGDKVADNKYLKAYPTTIVYKIISSIAWVLPKLKEGNLDIVRNISPSQFFEASQDISFSEKVDFFAPSQFAYHYLAFNSQSPKLADKRVREAIVHAIDRDRIIKEIFNGKAMKIDGPVLPNSAYCNGEIKETEYNLETAKMLLAKAGWKDTDGDDILDKKIGNELVRLRLKYSYNTGNLVRKAIGEMLKKDLEEIGIKLDLYPVDFSDLLKLANDRNYEVLALAWVNDPGLDDLKNVWHSTSNREDGGNRVGFGSAKTDKLIDDIRVTLDPVKREAMYMELQQKIVEEYPYAFLVIPDQLIMIRKGFIYPQLSQVSPGYIDRLFQKK